MAKFAAGGKLRRASAPPCRRLIISGFACLALLARLPFGLLQLRALRFGRRHELGLFSLRHCEWGIVTELLLESLELLRHRKDALFLGRVIREILHLMRIVREVEQLRSTDERES